MNVERATKAVGLAKQNTVNIVKQLIVKLTKPELLPVQKVLLVFSTKKKIRINRI
jgi:hypothetical protein